MPANGSVTEAEVRAALRAFVGVGVGGIERWVAEQRWEAVPGGWRVRERFDGWRFRVEPVAGGRGWWRPRPVTEAEACAALNTCSIGFRSGL
jgi:hypothetical protein